jgi:peptide-methionine (S)-S-oxide reductase
MRVSILILASLAFIGCSRAEATPMPTTTATAATAAPVVKRNVGTDPGGVGAGTPLVAKPGNELAAFSGGCFWGVEDRFRQVPGVVATAVGYTGGKTTNPTYESVCTHTTGHAETVLVEFDPKQVSYQRLLDLFYANHDPTTLNRQGPDHGDQYRSAIFTFSDDQTEAAKATAMREQEKLKKRVTTIIGPAMPFWKAEEYHQQYDEKSGTHSCPLVLPKST